MFYTRRVMARSYTFVIELPVITDIYNMQNMRYLGG